MYISKAKTALIGEIEKEITNVLESFTYEKVILTDGEKADEFLFPFRSYTEENGKISASIQGSNAVGADAEAVAVVVNSLLALGEEKFSIAIGHGKINADIKGTLDDLSPLDDSDELDLIYMLFDTLEGFGLSKYLTVDLTEKTEFDGLYFKAELLGKTVISGGRCGRDIEILFDALALSDVKCGDKELREKPPVVLIASDMSENMYKVALGLRGQGLKTEGYIESGSMTDAEEYCNLKGIPTLVWAGEDKVVMKNIVSGEMAETTLEKLLGATK